MKLIFFLIAFILVGIRYYFSWSGIDRERRGLSESHMVMTSDNFYESVDYSGKFELMDDESGFKSISPGGYFKFRKNDLKVKAESNLRGEIEYAVLEGNNTIPPGDQEKLLIAFAIREMIGFGYDAEGRMERVYQKGGIQALLNQADSMKMDPVRMIYLNKLLSIDSLSPENLQLVTKKMETLGNDMDKANFLNKVTPEQFQNPAIAAACFSVLHSMGSDMDKSNVLQHIISQDSLSESFTDSILSISSYLGSDMDKSNIYNALINKGLIQGPLFDSMTTAISQMGSDMDKVNLYSNLVKQSHISETQWITLIAKAAQLGSDMDKTNLLISYTQKMPRTEPIKSAYTQAAKSVGDDFNYGKLMRAIN